MCPLAKEMTVILFRTDYKESLLCLPFIYVAQKVQATDTRYAIAQLHMLHQLAALINAIFQKNYLHMIRVIGNPSIEQ